MFAAGISAALLGVALGPALAGLSVIAVTREPLIGRRTVIGGTASARRILVVTVLSPLTLGLLGSAIGWAPALPAFLWLGAVGVVLGVIDVEHHRLPDRLVLPSYVITDLVLLVAAVLTDDFTPWLRSLGAMAAVFGVLFGLAVISPSGLGFGDVKLGGLLGMHLGWLGWDYVVLGIVLGFVIGAVVSLALIAVRRASLRTAVAFGPALLVGTLTAIVAGPALLSG